MKLLEVMCQFGIWYHEYADDVHLYIRTPAWSYDGCNCLNAKSVNKTKQAEAEL